MNIILKCILISFFSFSIKGRISALQYTIVISVLMILGFIAFIIIRNPIFIVCSIVYILILGNIAVIRRSHDLYNQNINPFNRSQWGALYTLDSDIGSNRYGDEPLLSKRNLRKYKRKKLLQKLISTNNIINASKRVAVQQQIVEQLSVVFYNQRGIIFEGQISCELLEFCSDKTSIKTYSNEFANLGDICIYILILQLLPPGYYWHKKFFLEPYRMGRDGKMYLRPFSFNSCYLQDIFDAQELMDFIQENKSRGLNKMRQMLIEIILKKENEIGFDSTVDQMEITTELKRLEEVCAMI